MNRRWLPLSLLLGLAAGACRAQATPPDLTVAVDVQKSRHSISPLIYGVSFGGKNGAGFKNPLDRFGGNSTTRYNWKQNADNRANDWFFQSIADPDPTPGGVVAKFVAEAQAAGAAPMITVPAIGWVAKVAPDRSKLWSFSVKKYGPQEKTDSPWNPDSGSGKTSGGKEIAGNDPTDANLPTTPDYFRPWVKSLASKAPYFVLDNEPGIWQGTHRDVQPNGETLDGLFAKLRGTAAMIKKEAPQSQVCGPEEWGWTGFLYSGADGDWAKAHGWNDRASFPDRKAHGGLDAMPALLSQFAAEEKKTGKRLLDVFTLHFYPQGGEFTDDVSPAMQARRNRSTRALWDANYKDETWIADTVKLIPRMKAWRDAFYPGTKLGLTEYSWGAEKHMNGATVQADILGILGREGLDLANRWTCPGPKTPTYKAFQIFRSADGKGLAFGDTSVSCTAPSPDDLSAFAATDSKTGALTIALVAKAASGSRTVALNLAGFKPGRRARVFQLANDKLAEIPPSSETGRITVPCPSVTLIAIPAR